MRVRFAPSPTGFLHIGNARTAILNDLLAKKYNAELILRIEDTDKERSSKESEKSIINDLKWLGIKWHEGPDVGGEYGPYRQSERFDIYKKYTEKLLKEKKAYYCFCSPEDLEKARQNLEKGTLSCPGKCRELSVEKKEQLLQEGGKPTVRFRIPDNVEVEINDHIKGKVNFNSNNIGGDFIIVRSDGSPIYNYIVVIDDALMKISHVIRGEDHLSNTPKQILIARALGFPDPEYAHMPLVLGDDRKKLSKRHGITSVNIYKENGYLPESLVNYIGMLGWASDSGEEIISTEKIIQEIEINNLAKSNTIFDFKKLKWMNGHYIRSYNLDKLTDLFTPYIEAAGYKIENIDKEWLKDIINLIKIKCEILSDIKDLIGMFLEEIIPPTTEALEMLESEAGQSVAKAAYKLINGELNKDNFAAEFLNKIKEKTGQKGKNLFMPSRVVLTSNLHGPDLAEIMRLIGYEKCVKRINYIYENYCKE